MRGLALTIASLASLACSPLEEPLCGEPATLLETTTRTEDADEITYRTERSGSGGSGTVVRIEAPDGRLLGYAESPPTSGGVAGAAARAVNLVYDDADRLASASLLDTDNVGRPLATWQVGLTYADDGRIARVDAVGQPPSGQLLDDVLGTLIPGLSDGELTWLPPLPGADLLGPLPADIDALLRSRPPGLPIAMAADFTDIDGGVRADWRVGDDNFALALPVEHVGTDTGWLRTWIGERGLQTVSLGWSRFDDGAPGDGDLIWRLDGAEFERHRLRTTPIADGTRESHSVLREGRLVWLRVVERTGDDAEARTDENGDGVDDEIRVRLAAGEGRTIEVIDRVPFGPVDLYRFTEVEGTTVRVHAVAPDAGQQLCAVDGGPVVLGGQPGARRVEGVPDGLPDPPPQP